MKILMSAVLAITLLGGTAAFAQDHPGDNGQMQQPHDQNANPDQNRGGGDNHDMNSGDTHDTGRGDQNRGGDNRGMNGGDNRGMHGGWHHRHRHRICTWHHHHRHCYWGW